MAQLDALDLTNSLRQRMVDFALDDNFIHDPQLGEITRRIWSGPPNSGGLISDLWVEGAFPSKTAATSLDDLVHSGKFDSRLRDVLDSASAMPHDRKLYTHQLQAIEKAQSGAPGQRPTMVVTAGTGAGKTEAFLLPILNDLYQDPPKEKHGAKCIILYPMNALVNDQVDRLYNWLEDQAQVSLFHFTSETMEDKRRADAQDVPQWKRCRMRTRQQARGLESHDGKRIDEGQRGPTPDIVITNYSMLEYMLCRPQDSVFFGPGLRAVVLDEAHLYTGTLAAEITLLLRRLLLRCGLRSEDVLQVATSATLGTGDNEELRCFASTVFSKPAGMVHVITGEAARGPMSDPSHPEAEPTAAGIVGGEWLDGPAIVEDPNGRQELAVNQSGCEKLRSSLATLVSAKHLQTLDPNEDRPAVLLHKSLAAAPVIHRLEEILWNRKHIPLTELGELIFGESSEGAVRAVVQLLQLAASARLEPTSYPLVPHRIHVMARPADGLTVCLNSECAGLDNLLPPLGAVSVGYQDTCESCGSSTLSLERCRNCGEWLLSGQDKDSAIIAALPRARESEDGSQQQRRLILKADPSAPAENTVYIDPATGERRGSNAPGAVRMSMHTECPKCQADASQIASFYSGTPLTLSILAETLLADLPEFPAREGSNEWLPAQGRRLLAFSDSRREAARLGPLLTNQHEQQLVRAAIVQTLGESALGDEGALESVREDLDQTEQRLKNHDLSPGARQRLETRFAGLQDELTELMAGGSVGDWATALMKRESLSQVMDRPNAIGDSASNWSQTRWENNRQNVETRAREMLGRELASPIRRSVNTLESLGLVEVTYPGLDQLRPPAQFLGTLPTENLRESITKCWTDLLASLCDTLRTDGAITLGEDLDEEYTFGRMLIGRWASADNDVRSARLVRFVGATSRQRRLRFAAAVLSSCGMVNSQTETAAKDLLRACFNQLLDAARGQNLPWLKTSNRQAQGNGSVEAIRLDFFGLGLRRPATLFRCRTTGHVWPRSVAGCAPEAGCEGTLEPVMASILDNDPRLGRRRREFLESPIFKMGLWAEEHSAQLDPKENRRLQDLFKAGVRNILSSTTTLELGIDIGGLNGVLMSNVPPGKANYLQRAGRAGRRADGSSIVTTFSRPRPFDREVFQRIGDYLGMPLRRPVVFLDRERVVRRHLHAFLLGEFFRSVYSPGLHVGAMDAYGRMGGFCGIPRTVRWESGSAKPPVSGPDGTTPLSGQFADFLGSLGDGDQSGLRGYVAFLLSETSVNLGTSGWEGLSAFASNAFSQAVQDWDSEYEDLLDQWKEASSQGQANAIHYQLRLRHDTTVIEALADRQFLPRYGFPIAVLKLRVTTPDENRPNRVREEDQFRLERNSLLALREYVPGSQLLAGGRLIRSRGILKHWTGENIDTAIGLRGQYTKCKNDHLYYWTSGAAIPDCPFCRAPAGQSPVPYIVPQYGFSSAAWDPPKWSTDQELVGSVETVSATFTPAALEGSGYTLQEDFATVEGLTAFYREDGELLIYNRGDKERGFAICLSCGYSDSETKYGDGRVELPTDFENHAPLNNPRYTRRCWRANTAPPVLRNQTLAAREVTDVLLLDFSKCLGDHQADLALVTTLGYGLHRAAAKMLQLDGREIGVDTTPTGASGQGWGALLYDNVPGGAGHVRELLEYGEELLGLTKEVLFVDAAHDQRCRSACLDCLLSFETQDAMHQGRLNRPLALSVLSDLLDGREPRGSSTPNPDNHADAEMENPPAEPGLTIEQRQDRARANRGKSGRTRR